MRTGMLALGTGLACLPLLPELPPTWLSLVVLAIVLTAASGISLTVERRAHEHAALQPRP